MSNDLAVASLSRATNTSLYFLRWGMYCSDKDVPNNATPVITLETAQALAQSSTRTAVLC